MKERHLNIILATAILCADAIVLKIAFHARTYAGVVVGPFQFSKYLGIILAILCGFIIIQSLKNKQNDEKVNITNFDLVLTTIAMSAGLLILWQITGLFYPFAFIYILALCIILGSRCNKLTKKDIIFYLILTVVLMVVVYVLFNILMGLNL